MVAGAWEWGVITALVLILLVSCILTRVGFILIPVSIILSLSILGQFYSYSSQFYSSLGHFL